MPPPAQVRRTLYTLEALRGLAAMAVVLRHAASWFGIDLPSLHLAVDLFFILSGFVIAYAYETRLENGLSAAGFLRLRLIRLYPFYVLGLAVGVAAAAVGVGFAGDSSWRRPQMAPALLLNLVFLPGPGRYGEAFAFNLAAWSLFFELVANAAYVVFRRWLTTPVLVGVVIMGAVALIISERLYGSLNSGWTHGNFLGGFARVGFGFPMGVLLYRLLKDRPALSVSAWAPIAALAVVLLLPGGRHQGLYELAVALFVFPVLIAVGALTQPGPRSLGLFAFAGLLSYGVYVMHVPLIELGTAVALGLAGRPAASFAPALGLGFMVVLAGLVWALDRFYDAPSRKWLARRLTKRLPTARPIPNAQGCGGGKG